ncbi:hypothetical protein BGX29_008819 [Mortierella sp. GBA35]|nr:hypothetical protein BGX29_008819 [Mortierella sp. GBA35]
MGRKSGRNLNPADQYRKEQHKKEIKKNKQDRKKVRELGSVLRDTTTEGELAEHEELEKAGKLDKEGLKKLAELREKMAKIIEVKKAHGIKIKTKKVEAPKPAPVPVAEPVRDPTRSIYYDPVLNPYGAPPPGQPYLEYPPLPPEMPFGQGLTPGLDQQNQQQQQPEEESGSDSEESDSDSDSDSDLDSDSSSGSESEDEDDESFMPPLPEGPAPSKEDQAKYLESTKAKPSIDPRIRHYQQQPPMHGMRPPGMFPPGMHPPDMRGPPGQHINPYGPPMGFQPPYGNVYPPGRPGPGPGPPPMGHMPPPPPGFGPPGFGPPGYGSSGGFGGPEGPGGYGPPGYHQRPPYAGPPHNTRPSRPPSQRPPPRYVKPPRASDPQSDPMTGHLPPDEKEKKLQGENKESSSTPATPHPLPPKPTTTQVPAKPAVVAGPTSISAEPQLRNLQKELVHLVPSTIMRKRVTQKGKIGRPVNAAPGIEEDYRSAYPPPASTATSTAITTTTAAYSSENTTRESGKEEEEGRRETALGLRLPKINLAPSVPSFLSSTRMVINSAPEVPAAPVDKAAKKKAEYDEFMQGLEGDGLL